MFGQYGNLTCAALNNNDACGAGAASANSLAQPSSVSADSLGNLVVADYDNRRILYYPESSIALGGNITATKVYGQFGSFTCTADKIVGACTARTVTIENISKAQQLAMDILEKA